MRGHTRPTDGITFHIHLTNNMGESKKEFPKHAGITYKQRSKIQNMLYDMARVSITTHYKFYKLMKMSKQ
jgi:hypothetical protein